ncbi:hypothetical protein LguiA_022733 [Lonicera macranthoides]
MIECMNVQKNMPVDGVQYGLATERLISGKDWCSFFLLSNPDRSSRLKWIVSHLCIHLTTSENRKNRKICKLIEGLGLASIIPNCNMDFAALIDPTEPNLF